MDLKLKDKTVIVTGGRSGLGATICSGFINEGANVVAFDKLPSSKISQTNHLVYLQGDVTHLEDIDKAITKALDTFGQIDILVNNAGIWPSKRIIEMTEEEWDQVIRINLTGAFLFCRQFVKYLVDKNRVGSIVNIVSPAAYQGSANGHSHYAASKAALLSFTRSLALEMANKGIRAVAVAPGVMQTEMTQSMLETKSESYLKRIPLGRFILPEEVANVVLFAASERASSITGTMLDATGGMLDL